MAAPSSRPRAPEAPPRGASVERAYWQLRGLIVRGQLAPGSRLIESELCERLGLSRTPVRSGLHRLEQEGYVTVVQGRRERRLMVAPLTQADARELFQIVGHLEGLGARGAAELPDPARRAAVAELHRLNDTLALAGAAVPADQGALYDVDMAFHRYYVEAGGGPRLQALHAAIKPQTERYVRLYVSSLVEEMAKSITEHEAIIAQIAAGSGVLAQAAVEINWRNAAARLEQVIGTQGELGHW
jgi:DNA-binding GntR family transcriptional regulator